MLTSDLFFYSPVAADGMSTPKQASIKTMHDALFSNIDGDEGMAQTIAILQGLRGMKKDSDHPGRKNRVPLAWGWRVILLAKCLDSHSFVFLLS